MQRPKSAPWWSTLGPLLLALVLTPIAVRAASVLALSGPSALRLLYPWVVLLENHVLKLSAPQIESAAQWSMWLMLPIYSLMIIAMRRISTVGSGVILIILVHGLAVLAAISVS